MAFVPCAPTRHEPITNGSTSKSVFVYVQAASGLPATGLAYNTASLLASYAGTKLARVAITLADLAAITTAWTSGGFKEVDATNMPGWYRLDVPDAALALSADEVVVTIIKDGVAAGAVIIPIPSVTIGTAEAKLAVDTGTIGDVVDAIADGIPALDVVNPATTRTDA